MSLFFKLLIFWGWQLPPPPAPLVPTAMLKLCKIGST